MKKRLILMCLLVFCVTLLACKSDNKEGKAEDDNVNIQNFNIAEEMDNIVPENYNNFIEKSAIYYSNYVNVSDYSNITYSIRRNATDADDDYSQRKFDEIYRIISEQSKVLSYPKEVLEKLIKIYGTNIQNEYENRKDVYDSFADYIYKQYGFNTIDEFNIDAEKKAEDYLKQKMIIYIIAYKNGIDVTKEEIINYIEELANYYKYDSVSNLILEIGNELYEEVGYEILNEKVMNYLISISTNI